MKIGIISESLNRPITGVENYVFNLIKELLNLSLKKKDVDIELINYKKNRYFKNISEIIINNPFEKIFKTLWYPYAIYKLKENKEFDIIHNTRHFPTVFKLKYSKYMITVLDIMPIVIPPNKYSIKKYIMYRTLLPRTLKSADKIITISHHTKQDLTKYLKVPEDKIKVIHLAANENYKPLNENEINTIKQKYNLNYPFILYVGGLAPNKNVERLIKAYYKLKKQDVKHKLIITGVKRWKYKSIFETIDKLNLQKDVIFAGYVPDEDLPALYNAADLFVYPSLYEGFGLPPLEAMACGTPVITSNASSLPEVVGDAGIMVNPYDVDELAKAMYEVLTNDGLREELSKKGLERAKLFSWKKCAEEHLKV
jgi:glycosyltransferase involved in cell wall biosynthesis